MSRNELKIRISEFRFIFVASFLNKFSDHRSASLTADCLDGLICGKEFLLYQHLFVRSRLWAGLTTFYETLR